MAGKSKNPHGAKDALLRDASEAQRKNGKLPDSRADDELWAAQLEKVDQATEDVKKAARGKKTKHAPRAMSEDTRRTLEERGWTVLGPAQMRTRAERRRARRAAEAAGLTPQDKAELFMMARRLTLLGYYPEWKARIIAAYDLGARLAAADPNCMHPELVQDACIREVLDASSELFGDWRALRPRTVTGLPTGKVKIK